MVRKNRSSYSSWRGLLFAASLVMAFVISTGIALASMPASQKAQVVGPNIADVVPPQVRSGAAQMVGKHSDSDTLTVLFMMPFKDQAGLDAFLTDVSNPNSPNYGRYLTLEEENARFNPDVASEQRVSSWLSSEGVAGVKLVPNHLYVYVRASSASMSKLLNVQINDYVAGDQTFYAPDRVPTLPASVSADVNWIAGLSNEDKLQTYHVKLGNGTGKGSSSPDSTPPYTPQDYAAAYNANPILNAGYNGAGTNIAITLWSQAPSDTTLNGWSGSTGSPVATRANGRLTIILTDGSQSTDTDDTEAALDIESSSGLATHANIRYYEALQPTYADMANALNIAGTDAVFNRFISNSWGGAETSSGYNTTNPVLQANAATGHDYIFSSGDDGSWTQLGDPYPNIPASSAYVTAIGGTRFIGNIVNNWPGERSWDYDPTGNNGHPEGTGGGYSRIAGHPSWQVAPGFPGGQTHRGYPDVSSVGDPATGMYVCGNLAGCIQVGGTSLSAPLWAGMFDIVDQYVVAQNKPHLGFVNPTLYQLAQSPQTYAPYHDITSGTNGAYNCSTGWDAVTGLGTPDLWNLARDLAPPPPCPGNQFTDVCPGDTYYQPITNLVNANVLSGYNTSPPCPASSWIPCFLPGNTATRGQIAKIITLGANIPINTSGGPHFSDVPNSSTFYQYIETMYNAGVISGYTTGCSTGNPCFRPGNPVTRSQLTKMASIGFGFTEAVSGQPFQDIAVGSTYYEYIGRLYARNIIGGYACGGAGEPCGTGNKPYFRPNNNLTRGQLSKIVDLCRQQ